MTGKSNKIEKLTRLRAARGQVEELCPDGVEVREIWEVTAWDKKFNGIDRKKQQKVITYPYVLAKKFKELAQETGSVRLLSTGDYIGFTSKELAGENLCEGEIVAIPWGGQANIKYYKGKFVTADNRIATSLDTAVLLNKFLYYWMLENNRMIESFYRGSGIKHPSMKKVLEMKIPIPPLAIQQEIVKILDTFTTLEAELEAELEARTKQYEYYRDELLTFGEDVEWKTLGEVADVRDGTHDSPKKSTEGMPLVTSKNIKNNTIDLSSAYLISEYDYHQVNKRSKVDKWDVLFSMIGTVGEVAVINSEPIFAIKNVGLVKIGKELFSKYIAYYLTSNRAKEHMFSTQNGSAQKFMSLSMLRNFPIPIPPLAEQERIVAILDKFDSLVNDISAGLPAELKARRKQYEYYRNKLLSFQEKP